MSTIKILFLGDIFAKIGRQAVIKILPQLQKEYEPDLVIANAENLSHARGVTEKTLQEMQFAGIDYFTSGNHIFDKNDSYLIMNKKDSGENRFGRLGRRAFLRICGALLGGTLLSGKLPRSIGRAYAGAGEARSTVKGERSPRRLIYIAIDALHPKYLELNSKGLPSRWGHRS